MFVQYFPTKDMHLRIIKSKKRKSFYNKVIKAGKDYFALQCSGLNVGTNTKSIFCLFLGILISHLMPVFSLLGAKFNCTFFVTLICRL